MAHLGRRPRASGSVIDLSQLPSPSPSGSYHLNHSDSTLSIRMQKRRWSNFDTAPTIQWQITELCNPPRYMNRNFGLCPENAKKVE